MYNTNHSIKLIRSSSSFHLDYYCFGSVISSRTRAIDESYRYGFSNQEKDPEMGEYYAFEYRIHDARLGRFLSIDPLSKKFPFYSPYQFASNSPIVGKELEGLENKDILNISEKEKERHKNDWNFGNTENTTESTQATSTSNPSEKSTPINVFNISTIDCNTKIYRFQLTISNGNTTPIRPTMKFGNFTLNNNYVNTGKLEFYHSNQNYNPAVGNLFFTDPSNKYQLDIFDSKTNLTYGFSWQHPKMEMEENYITDDTDPNAIKYAQFKFSQGGMTLGPTIGYKSGDLNSKYSFQIKLGPCILLNKMEIDVFSDDGKGGILRVVQNDNARNYGGQGGHLDVNINLKPASWMALGVGFGGSFLNINANTPIGNIRGNAFTSYWSLSLNFPLVKF